MPDRPRFSDSETAGTEDLHLLGEAPLRPTSGERAGLVLLHAPDPRAVPHVVELSASEPLMIGRETPAGGLTLPQTAVSRVHARVHRAPGGWTVTDLDSRNGTLVNGRRVGEAVLEHQDELRVGDAIFVFVARGIDAFAGHRIDRPVSATERVAGPQTRAVFDALRAVGPSNLAVLVLGETGTGKELAARAVHAQSGRRGRFAALNCAAVPTHIVESELFGHRRGAFTGADRDKLGLIGSADGGTLFLDEVGDLGREAQAKLLRVLETGELFPLGATTPERVDVRFVAATNRDLPRLVEAGSFRADLYARLSGHVALLPPLRTRKEELMPLTRHLFAKHGRKDMSISTPAAAALCHHDWPFNVRELESLVRRAIALLDAKGAPPTASLELEHLPESVLEGLTGYGDPREAASAAATDATAPDAELLREALVRHRGNVAAVAREMRKDRVQIHRWMRRFGLDPSDFRG